MATAENAKLNYEAGQSSVAMGALTDSGDSTTFTSSASLWSGRSGFTPDVLPNGVLTGGAVTASTSNDQVSVAALTLNLNGVATSVAAGTVSVTRPATNVAKVVSITVNSSGSLVEVAGTSATNTTFVETRGAAGGPPYIPVTSVEIAQVRVTSSTAALVESTEIFQVVGTHLERADFPIYDINYDEGSVTFTSAIAQNHTGDTAKGVYAAYAEPIFAEVGLASDFVPPETSHSVTSTQVYNSTIGSSSSTLGQGSFTAYLQTGVDDAMVTLKNETLWFQFYPDRYKSGYILAQGKLGISRTFPAGDNISAACTISASSAATEVVS
jgi:hypothetical protein